MKGSPNLVQLTLFINSFFFWHSLPLRFFIHPFIGLTVSNKPCLLFLPSHFLVTTLACCISALRTAARPCIHPPPSSTPHQYSSSYMKGGPGRSHSLTASASPKGPSYLFLPPEPGDQSSNVLTTRELTSLSMFHHCTDLLRIKIVHSILPPNIHN